ncbi:MAG: hypothetical protein IJP03_03050 [Christensenellaceae bacterium]|nr:hypothetical protein [Christensenellaceae bacterium]
MDKTKTRSYWKGLLGALLGAVAALIAWVAVAYFVGQNLHLSFGFVMALMAYMGYVGMGGKKGRGMYAIYPLVVLVMGLLAFFLARSLQAVDSMGSEMIEAYAQAQFGGSVFKAVMNLLGMWLPAMFESFSALWTDVAISVVFELAGGAYFMMKMRDELSELEKAEVQSEAKEDGGQDEQPEEESPEE